MSAKAILVVHIYGRQIDMDQVHAIAERYGLFVIEDMAEAHGVRPHPKTHAVCHSFYRNKIVAGEEGGAVWFYEPNRAALARCLRSLGFTEAHDFMHVPRGHNYRMSNAHAYLVLKSLAEYPANVAKRREMVDLYDAACPAEWRMPPRDAPWVYDFRIPGLDAVTQDQIIRSLQTWGVAARHCFKPMTRQEEFLVERPENRGDMAAREVIYLPLTGYVPTRDRVGAEAVFALIQSVLEGKRWDHPGPRWTL